MLLRPFVVLTLVLSFSLAASSGDPKDNNSNSIQGTWQPAMAELGGKMVPEEVRKSIKLVVKDDKYTVTIGKAVDQGTIKVNAAAKPKEIDITGSDGPNKGKTILAIYERDGDTLRICYDLSGKGRPAEFKTQEGAPLFLVTYKKDKTREPTAAQKKIARRIAGGHAYDKHVVEEKQFPDVKSESDFADLIGKVLANPTHQRKLENGREAYFDNKSNTIVIYNPRARDNGTCFRPRAGLRYYENLK